MLHWVVYGVLTLCTVSPHWYCETYHIQMPPTVTATDGACRSIMWSIAIKSLRPNQHADYSTLHCEYEKPRGSYVE